LKPKSRYWKIETSYYLNYSFIHAFVHFFFNCKSICAVVCLIDMFVPLVIVISIGYILIFRFRFCVVMIFPYIIGFGLILLGRGITKLILLK